jgi:hypothetical protein
MLGLCRIAGILIGALGVALVSLTSPRAATAQTSLDSAVFVTRLGSDTLVLERVISSPRRVEAEVAMRVPTTTRTTYVLELSPSGILERMEALTFDTTARGTPRSRSCASGARARPRPLNRSSPVSASPTSLLLASPPTA